MTHDWTPDTKQGYHIRKAAAGYVIQMSECISLQSSTIVKVFCSQNIVLCK